MFRIPKNKMAPIGGTWPSPGLCNFFKLWIINVLNEVNGVLLRKTVGNKFITVTNVASNMLLRCNSIPEFVAVR